MLDSRSDLWAVVLAGGAGNPQPLLRHTLDRVARLIPPSRTVAVTQASHADHVAGELVGHAEVTVLAQPSDRGTAAGVLLAAHWIRSRAPGAVIAVFPTNHFIAGGGDLHEPRRRRGRVRPGSSGMAPATRRAPDRAGARPRLDRAGRADRLDGLRRRGPSHPGVPRAAARRARAPSARSRLCNTFVFTATAMALVDAGRARLPLLHDRLTRFALFAGTRYEPHALQQAYLFAPTADFTRAILASSRGLDWPSTEIPSVDLVGPRGTPERVARSVGAEGRHE